MPFPPALRAAFAGLLAMAAAMGVGRFVYTPILPLMIEAGSLDRSQAGLVAGANFLGYLIGALAASSAVFQPRPRLWCFAGLGLSIATTAAMGLDTGLRGMIAIRLVSGIASAFAMIFITAMVMRQLARSGKPGYVALHFGGVGLGIAASAIMVSRLDALGFGWPQIWMATAMAALAAALPAFMLLPKPAGLHFEADQETAQTSGFGLPLAVLTFGYGFFGFGYVITATFINAMAKADPVLAPVEPWVWVVVGLSGLPSLWLWNRFAANAGLTAAYCLACLVEALGVFVSVMLASPWVLLASAVMLGGTFMAITSLGFARARTMRGGHDAKAIALMTAAFGFGQMAGPVVAGFLYEGQGSLFVPSLLAGTGLLIAAAFGAAAELLHQRRSAP